jgi:chromosome segregation ATPase
MKKKTDDSIKIPSANNEDQPASRKMLHLVRDELKSDIRTLSRKMDSRFSENDSKLKSIDARFNEVDARFNEVDARFNEVDAQFKQVDARFSEMHARFDEMKADHFRTQVLLEEQHSNNRIVLEGLQGLWQRQERIEQGLNRR